jgi:hypothetical protein
MKGITYVSLRRVLTKLKNREDEREGGREKEKEERGSKREKEEREREREAENRKKPSQLLLLLLSGDKD